MSKYNPNSPVPRRRTIQMPKSRSACISTVADYLGMTGEDFIQAAITEKLTAVLGDMVSTR